jgi:hypothetical protein
VERSVRKAQTDGCPENGSVHWPKYDLMKNPIIINLTKEASIFFEN